jgi:hypothetical protein
VNLFLLHIATCLNSLWTNQLLSNVRRLDSRLGLEPITQKLIGSNGYSTQLRCATKTENT